MSHYNSPGFQRLARNAGKQGMEAMRQRTLAEQARAVSEVQHSATTVRSERADGYPEPRPVRRKRT